MIVMIGGHWFSESYAVGGILWVIGNILMWLDK